MHTMHFQDLLETNIRQRGDIGGSAKKVGLRIKELERIYGIKVGNPNYEKNSQLKTQTQLANDMGMDVRTLQNYKLLAEMIPELSDLVDTGIRRKATGGRSVPVAFFLDYIKFLRKC